MDCGSARCTGALGRVALAAPVLAALAWAIAATVPVASAGTSGALAADPATDPAAEASPIMTNVDIRPGLCPNHIRLESPLAIPIAILGGVDFELDLVDPATVRLYREGADGEVMLRGSLTTGEAIEGVDCALVISANWSDETLGEEVGLLAYEEEAGGEDLTPARHRFSYYTTVSERVTIAIYDTQGHVVARLNDMDMAPGIYNATWNGMDENREEAPAGIYFARVNNSVASDTRKFVVQ